MHTADFTPPIAPYPLDEENDIVHFHFGIEKIPDEAGALWYNIGTELSSERKKFGTQSLLCATSFLQRLSKLTLGGKDFSIACWAYAPSENSAIQNIFCWGDATNRFGVARHTSHFIYPFSAVGGTTELKSADVQNSVAFPTGQWVHVEFDYRHSDKKLFLFLKIICNKS